MAYELITVERKGEHDGIIWLELNRPEKLNALTFPLLAEMYDALTKIRMDRTARVLVITGKGRGFCAAWTPAAVATAEARTSGTTTPTRSSARPTPPTTPTTRASGSTSATRPRPSPKLRRLDIPVIAGVNGPCVGAGFDMACLCDLLVASTNARYQVAYVKRGLYADLGGFWAIPKIIGWRKAMERCSPVASCPPRRATSPASATTSSNRKSSTRSCSNSPRR